MVPVAPVTTIVIVFSSVSVSINKKERSDDVGREMS
jgi:hypothetical protein